MTTTNLNRRQSIIHVFETILSSEQLTRVLNLYDEAELPGSVISLNDFCRQIRTIMPEVDLPHDTRVLLLRALRRPITIHDDESEMEDTLSLPLMRESSDENVFPGQPTRQEDGTAALLPIETPRLQTKFGSGPKGPSQTDADTITQQLGQPIRKIERAPRKPTYLKGKYKIVGDNGHDDVFTGLAIFENLSHGGARLHLLEPHTIKIGTTLLLQFMIDITDSPSIRTTAQARWVMRDRVGVQFLVPDELPQALLDYVEY